MNQELSTNPFNPIAPPKAFDEIKVSLASPERILSWYSFLIVRVNGALLWCVFHVTHNPRAPHTGRREFGHGPTRPDFGIRAVALTGSQP